MKRFFHMIGWCIATVVIVLGGLLAVFQNFFFPALGIIVILGIFAWLGYLLNKHDI